MYQIADVSVMRSAAMKWIAARMSTESERALPVSLHTFEHTLITVPLSSFSYTIY